VRKRTHCGHQHEARCFAAVGSGLANALTSHRFNLLALGRRYALPAAPKSSGALRGNNLQASEAADPDSALTTHLPPIRPTNAVTH
jgi:hypothetical protein